jgi:hypothetical protein
LTKIIKFIFQSTLLSNKISSYSLWEKPLLARPLIASFLLPTPSLLTFPHFSLSIFFSYYHISFVGLKAWSTVSPSQPPPALLPHRPSLCSTISETHVPSLDNKSRFLKPRSTIHFQPPPLTSFPFAIPNLSLTLHSSSPVRRPHTSFYCSPKLLEPKRSMSFELHLSSAHFMEHW